MMSTKIRDMNTRFYLRFTSDHKQNECKKVRNKKNLRAFILLILEHNRFECH